MGCTTVGMQKIKLPKKSDEAPFRNPPPFLADDRPSLDWQGRGRGPSGLRPTCAFVARYAGMDHHSYLHFLCEERAHFKQGIVGMSDTRCDAGGGAWCPENFGSYTIILR